MMGEQLELFSKFDSLVIKLIHKYFIVDKHSYNRELCNVNHHRAIKSDLQIEAMYARVYEPVPGWETKLKNFKGVLHER